MKHTTKRINKVTLCSHAVEWSYLYCESSAMKIICEYDQEAAVATGAAGETAKPAEK